MHRMPDIWFAAVTVRGLPLRPCLVLPPVDPAFATIGDAGCATLLTLLVLVTHHRPEDVLRYIVLHQVPRKTVLDHRMHRKRDSVCASITVWRIHLRTLPGSVKTPIFVWNSLSSFSARYYL